MECSNDGVSIVNSDRTDIGKCLDLGSTITLVSIISTQDTLAS